jgi:hypothetical protein
VHLDNIRPRPAVHAGREKRSFALFGSFALFDGGKAQFELEPDAAERRAAIIRDHDAVHFVVIEQLARPPQRLVLGRESLGARTLLIAPFVQ